MDSPGQSLSERLSGLLASLKNPKQKSSEESSTSVPIPDRTQEKASTEIDTLPELLVFIKKTSNPKVLRDMLVHFLSNPLLSENDRELVRKKVREKIDEEKRKKKDSKKAAMGSDVSVPSTSSSLQSLHDYTSHSISQANIHDRKETVTSTHIVPESLSSLSQGTYHGSLLEKLKKLNEPEIFFGTTIDQMQADHPGSEVKLQIASKRTSDTVSNEAPPIDSDVQETKQRERTEASDETLYNRWMLMPPEVAVRSTPSITSVPPFTMNAEVFSVPPPQFQIPPPNFMPATVIANHAFAGFQAQETLLGCTSMTSSTFSERDRIPRTPTPSPPPPPSSPDPRIRPGALVAVISDAGRLVMPGARVFRRNKEKVKNYGNSSLAAATRTYYIRHYAIHHKVSLEEAERMIEREEWEFQNTAHLRRLKKRLNVENKEEDSDEIRRDKNVYTKGFEPLPKQQKYAKNYDDTEEYGPELGPPEWMESWQRRFLPDRIPEEGEIVDESFDYDDFSLSVRPESAPEETNSGSRYIEDRVSVPYHCYHYLNRTRNRRRKKKGCVDLNPSR